MNTLFTNKGREKLAKAQAGDIALSAITHIAFGTGGHAPGDVIVPVAPDPAAATLENEVIRKAVESHTFTSPSIMRYSCKLLKADVNGQVITEAGLIDSQGDLIAIKTFGGKVKENDTEFWFDWDAKY